MEKKYDVLSRIEERYHKMSKSHKAIADFISEHYDQAVFMTAAVLGGTLGISESGLPRASAMTVTRSFKKAWRTASRGS